MLAHCLRTLRPLPAIAHRRGLLPGPPVQSPLPPRTSMVRKRVTTRWSLSSSWYESSTKEDEDCSTSRPSSHLRVDVARLAGVRRCRALSSAGTAHCVPLAGAAGLAARGGGCQGRRLAGSTNGSARWRAVAGSTAGTRRSGWLGPSSRWWEPAGRESAVRGKHQVTEMKVGRPTEAGSRAGPRRPPSHLPRLQASSAALRSLGGVLIMPGSSQSSTSGSPLSQRPASFLPHSSRLEEGRVVTSAGRAPWAAGWGSWRGV